MRFSRKKSTIVDNEKYISYYICTIPIMFEKYTNSEIEQDIQEKGFSVYTYIDTRELFLSIKKDYIHLISLMYWVFLWVSVVAGIIFWQSNGDNLVYF